MREFSKEKSKSYILKKYEYLPILSAPTIVYSINQLIVLLLEDHF